MSHKWDSSNIFSSAVFHEDYISGIRSELCHTLLEQSMIKKYDIFVNSQLYTVILRPIDNIYSN